MIALELALGIVNSLLELAVEHARHLSDEAAVAHWAKFDARVAPFERVIDVLTRQLHG